MNKQITAVLITVSTLACLCACGREKPELEPVSVQTESSEGSSVRETEKARLTRSDSRIMGKLDDKFDVDAYVLNEKKELPAYYILNRINLTEDQLAEKLMSKSGYVREDKDLGIVTFANDDERLVIDLAGKTNPMYLSPNLTYASADMGKYYEFVFRGSVANTNEGADSAEAAKAVSLVKEMLNKLPVQYHDDFEVEKIDSYDLNSRYSVFKRFREQNDIDIPDENKDKIAKLDRSILYGNLLLLTEGKNAELDKDFIFSEDNSCFLVCGFMKADDLQINTPGTYPDPSIKAVVSSRGIEYLYIEDLYIPDNGSLEEAPLISPEQAIEAVYKDYAASPNKDNFRVKIEQISLNYLKEEKQTGTDYMFDDKATAPSSVKLRPAWTVKMAISNLERQDGINGQETKVYADNGKVVISYFEEENAITFNFEP